MPFLREKKEEIEIFKTFGVRAFFFMLMNEFWYFLLIGSENRAGEETAGDAEASQRPAGEDDEGPAGAGGVAEAERRRQQPAGARARRGGHACVI